MFLFDKEKVKHCYRFVFVLKSLYVSFLLYAFDHLLRYIYVYAHTVYITRITALGRNTISACTFYGQCNFVERNFTVLLLRGGKQLPLDGSGNIIPFDCVRTVPHFIIMRLNVNFVDATVFFSITIATANCTKKTYKNHGWTSHTICSPAI